MRRPKMNSVLVCVKCNSGQESDSVSAARRPTRWHGIGLKFDGAYSDEALVRTCTRCGYEWEEACEDHQG